MRLSGSSLKKILRLLCRQWIGVGWGQGEVDSTDWTGHAQLSAKRMRSPSCSTGVGWGVGGRGRGRVAPLREVKEKEGWEEGDKLSPALGATVDCIKGKVWEKKGMRKTFQACNGGSGSVYLFIFI